MQLYFVTTFINSETPLRLVDLGNVSKPVVRQLGIVGPFTLHLCLYDFGRETPTGRVGNIP